MRRAPIDIAAASFAVLVLLVVPIVLAAFVGWPLQTPSAVTKIWSRRTSRHRGLHRMGGLGGMFRPLVRRVIHRIRTGDTDYEIGGRASDWLTARIATAVIALLPTTAASALAVDATALQHEPFPSSRTILPSPLTSVGETQTRSANFDSRNQAIIPIESSDPTPLPPPVQLLGKPFWNRQGNRAAESSPSRKSSNFGSSPNEPIDVASLDLSALLSDLATGGICSLGAFSVARRSKLRRPKCRFRRPTDIQESEMGSLVSEKANLTGPTGFDVAGLTDIRICQLVAGVETLRHAGGLTAGSIVSIKCRRN